MGFDDFIENKRRHNGNWGRQVSYDDHDYAYPVHHSHHRRREHEGLLKILQMIRSSKKFRVLAIVACILVLAIAVFLLVALLPLIIRLFHYINENGLQGLLDGITGFLDKLWKGSGK